MTSTSESLPPQLSAIAKGVWWLVLLRGILAVIFGVIAFSTPGIALIAVTIVFGAYAVVDGVVAIAHAIGSRKTLKAWGWLLFQGIVSVLAGIAALLFPALIGAFGGLFVLWTIVIYAIMHGAAGIASASGAEGKAKTWGIVGGVLTLLFGILYAILILVIPGATLLSLIWIIAAYAIIFGIMLIVTAIQVRRHVSAATA